MELSTKHGRINVDSDLSAVALVGEFLPRTTALDLADAHRRVPPADYLRADRLIEMGAVRKRSGGDWRHNVSSSAAFRPGCRWAA